MESFHPHEDIRVIKYYSEKYSDSKSLQIQSNIGEVSVNYQYKVFNWIN